MYNVKIVYAVKMFIYSLLRNILYKKYIFIRLSPAKGNRIHFYSRKSKKIFSVKSYDKISSLTADQIFTNHEYDLTFLKAYTMLVEYYRMVLEMEKVPLIIDCGANMGYSSIYFSVFFPGSYVYAIEPSSVNHVILEENVKNWKHIKVFKAAIGSVNGYCRILDEEASNNAFRTEVLTTEHFGGKIDVISISTLISLDVNVVPFIVKIDIEGFEDELFKENYSWIDKVPLIIIELHDWLFINSGNSQNFLKAISQFKRDFVIRGENVYSIRPNLLRNYVFPPKVENN